MTNPLNWITVEDASTKTGYYGNYLRLLCRMGVLNARKLVNRVWLIEPESLDAYLKMRLASGDPRAGPHPLSRTGK